MNIDDCLTNESRKLYQALIDSGAKISLEINESLQCWRVEEILAFKISSSSGNADAASLAHELLHIKLSLQGWANPRIIYSYYNENNSLFTTDFITTFDNNLAHFKMIDGFVNMGFNIDSFLADTPKEYLMNNIMLSLVRLQVVNSSKIANICDESREIIQLVAGAKLFGLYKLKDKTTVNGIYEDIILEPLRVINRELVDGLDGLFNDWIQANTVNNLEFYKRLDFTLKSLGLPNAVNCTK